MPNQSNTMVIEGAWRMESYVRNREAVSLTGVLLMTAGRWSTLYFIPQPGANECWGSAESGRYDVKGDRLTFHHEFAFQGGGDEKLVIDLASTTVEICKIVLTSEILKIYFPSGNVIHCRRYSE
jgi:predicted acyltransferase